MASLFKKGDKYHLSFYNKEQSPKREQVSLKTKSKRVAIKRQRSLEEQYELGQYQSLG